MNDKTEDEFDVEAARECILEEIVGCYNCQPWEQEPIWLGPKTDLEDLLNDCDIDEKHWGEVLEGLSCPSCGTPLNEINDEVEIKSEYDKTVEIILARAKSNEIVKKLKTFNSYIKEYTYLGLSDPQNTGSEIFGTVKKLGKYQLLQKEWYRARRINEESKIYSSKEMGAPDPEKVYVREGRYNHTGQAFLYLADNAETAFKEIKSDHQNLCAIQIFKNIEDINVLDLRQSYTNINPKEDLLALAIIYNGFIYRSPSQTSSWKPEYFVPRFVADCARNAKFDGILFSSVVSHRGENLAVFPHKISKFIPDGACQPFHFEEKPNNHFHIDLTTMYNPILDDEEDDDNNNL